MKILHIVKYVEDRPNGIKTVIKELIPSQINEGLKVTLLNLEYEKKYDKLKEEYDLVIFHGIYIREYLYIYKKLKKNPYIIIPHCSLTKESQKRGRIKKIIFNIIARKFYYNSQAIGFLNLEEEKNSIKINNRYVILPNGIRLPSFKNNKKIVKDNINFIYLSRIDIYHKGLDLLIEAVKNIKDELLKRNVIINIYGNAYYKKNLNYLINQIEKNKLEKILKYHGRVDGEEKEEVLRESDIFILTSRFEGFPMSVLEALSYGLPCILTEGTNMKSMIKKYNSGWICETKVSEISKIILQAIEEYRVNKDEYISYALRNAKDYEWEKVVLTHIKEFNTILNIGE